MLKVDEKLPFLHDVWSPEGMRSFLNEHLTPQAGRDRQIAGVTIENTAYRPGRGCSLLCSLVMDDGTADLCVVSFAMGDGLQEAYARCYASPGARSTARAVSLPAWHGLVEFFPNDCDLPGLATAFDVDQMRPFIATNAIDIIAYRPHRRCVLRYAAESNHGSCAAIGKVYARPDDAHAAWDIQRRLRAGRRRTLVSVPEPLAVVDRANMLLMAGVAGTPMQELLRDSSPQNAATLMRLAAETLATLQSFEIDRPEARSLESEIEHALGRSARLRSVAPPLAAALEDTLERVSALAGALACPATVFAHGDFKLSQLIVDRGRPSVVDFDRACVADPALDAGNFMADVRRQALLIGRGDGAPLAGVFIEEYRSVARARDLERPARLFEIVVLVRMAARAFRQAPQVYGSAPESAMPNLLLQQARSCLEAL